MSQEVYELQITVHEADGLRAVKEKNFLGIPTTSDPFVEVRLCSFGIATPPDEKVFLGNTHPVFKTLAPSWDTLFQVELPAHYFAEDAMFEVSIMSTHHPLGVVPIPIFSGSSTTTKWYGVPASSGQGMKGKGRIRCSLSLTRSFRDPNSRAPELATEGEPIFEPHLDKVEEFLMESEEDDDDDEDEQEEEEEKAFNASIAELGADLQRQQSKSHNRRTQRKRVTKDDSGTGRMRRNKSQGDSAGGPSGGGGRNRRQKSPMRQPRRDRSGNGNDGDSPTKKANPRRNKSYGEPSTKPTRVPRSKSHGDGEEISKPKVERRVATNGVIMKGAKAAARMSIIRRPPTAKRPDPRKQPQGKEGGGQEENKRRTEDEKRELSPRRAGSSNKEVPPRPSAGPNRRRVRDKSPKRAPSGRKEHAKRDVDTSK